MHCRSINELAAGWVWPVERAWEEHPEQNDQRQFIWPSLNLNSQLKTSPLLALTPHPGHKELLDGSVESDENYQ